MYSRISINDKDKERIKDYIINNPYKNNTIRQLEFDKAIHDDVNNFTLVLSGYISAAFERMGNDYDRYDFILIKGNEIFDLSCISFHKDGCIKIVHCSGYTGFEDAVIIRAVRELIH
ncbi:MAG: hypothetical protein IJ763_09455 [Lachnospiraceae bacterium]|nr:hypothetical protein [Lachnospiraceae bacterium]